jgi:DNA-binding NarL/FixJ family response regulator
LKLPSVKRVVIVDDDVLIAMHLRKLCEESGTSVVGVAHDGRAAQEMILTERPDYVFMDLRLEGVRDGVDIANEVRDILPDIKFIFVTGASGKLEIARIQSVKPKQILSKPVTGNEIRGALS